MIASDEDIQDISLENLLNLSVSTSSLRAQPYAWTPNNSIVVTRHQIRMRGYVNLKDLLADLPGVDVYNNFSEELPALISIRGNPGNTNFVILHDGRRISTHTGEPWPVDDNYPIFDAKQVEVIYGPASALYGTDALSGIINIISDDLTSEYGGQARVTYGSNNYVYGAAEAHGEVGHKLRLRLSGHFQRSSNTNLASEYPNDFPAIDLQQLRDPFSGAIIDATRSDEYFHGTSSHSFEATALFDLKFELHYSERRFDMPTSNNVIAAYTKYGTESQFISRNIHARFMDAITDALRSETTVTYAVLDFGEDYSFDNYFSNYAPVYKSMESQTFGINQQLTYDLSEEHHLIAGAFYSRADTEPYSIDLTSKPDEDRPLSVQGFKIPGTELTAPIYDVEMWSAGGFAQIQSQWADWVSTTAGIRYDHDNRYGHTFNPRASVVFRPGEGHTFKLLYGEGYLAPSTFAQYPLYGAFTGVDEATGKPRADWYHLPQPDLEPLKIRTIEVGDTLLITKELLFNASAYYSALRNKIINVYIEERTEFAGGIIEGVEKSFSWGRSDLWGGSAGLEYKLRSGEFGFDVWANYTLSLGKAVETTDGREVELAQNTVHKVKGGLAFHYQGLHFTTLARYSGPTTHVSFTDETQTSRLSIPGALVIDSTLLVEDLVEGASLSLNVRNLLDTHYYSLGSHTIVNLARSPQETRQIMLTLAYQM